MKTQCQECGIQQRPMRIMVSGTHFCSRECYILFSDKHTWSQDSDYYKYCKEEANSTDSIPITNGDAK